MASGLRLPERAMLYPPQITIWRDVITSVFELLELAFSFDHPVLQRKKGGLVNIRLIPYTYRFIGDECATCFIMEFCYMEARYATPLAPLNGCP
ncbi:predicted protein [Histoplasma capsulatum var. duboisii H88]|uniref:Predicted protein n=2 Tax=Ajellomyces capsulatus TaxID=5037 RepID=F0UQA3_AJEC8|nr:predicted protein [Histoplasma capsulatum H143]EGC47101.1 predicted protein [Histoplasma capsulatum var. duboisii H88]